MPRLVLALLLVAILSRAPAPAVLAQGEAAIPAITAFAVHLSGLQAAGRLRELYGLMHPDARAVVPWEVFRDWHERRVAPRQPGVLTVRDVRFEPWTWGVTGKHYANAALVAYSQPVAGQPVPGSMRLAPTDDGSWGWFFGRSRTFLERQIARSARAPSPAAEASAAACERWVAASLAQLVPPVAAGYVGGWFELTAAEMDMPAGCALPALPPETPWCVGDPRRDGYCTEPIVVRHTPDGRGFCVGADPGATRSCRFT